jgi:tetratricopeptide (TPR) repeat protein
MKPCVLLVCATVLGSALPVIARADVRQVVLAGRDADALYARREVPAEARRAAEIWAEVVRRNPRDFEAAWKLARVRNWLGDHAPDGERSRHYESGVEGARLAIAAAPNRPEGHYWLGVNMGALADLGTMAALKYHKAVREELETTVRLDPGFEGGSALTVLGDWYLRVPGFLGGNKTRAEELLRRALTYDPNSVATRYFLAETLLATNRKPEALAELQKALDAPIDPDWGPETREWKQKTREMLLRLRASK